MILSLANLVVAAHGLLVACVVVGGLLAIAGKLHHHRRWQRVYYALISCVIASDVLFGECVMTRWEKALRNLDRPDSAYRESCLGHYLPGLPPLVLSHIGPLLLLMAILAAPLWQWRERRFAALQTSALEETEPR